MASLGSILILDRDSELVTILSSYLSALGYRPIFTTRVREAIKKLRNQKFHHLFIDPDLKPDQIEPLIDEIQVMGNLNQNTPLTFMTSNMDIAISMDHVKRVKAILPKPFTLREFNHKLLT